MIEMETISEIEDVEKYRGKHVYVEEEWNSYRNGFRFVYDRDMTHFSSGGDGYSCANQIGDSGVHGNCDIYQWNLNRGYIKIRLATPEEVSKIKISYNADGRGWH